MTETIRIEALGRDVSRIALGTSSMGGGQWAGDNDQRRSVETVLHALELGIDMVDTAPSYGRGLSERVVGEALAGANARDRMVIATKAGFVWGDDGELRHDASRDGVRRQLEESLRRLGTDRVDVYQLHFADPAVPLAETAESFAALRDEGLIRAVGVCNLTVEQMREWRSHAPLDTVQDRYSVFDREAEEAVLPYCHDAGAVFMAYSPLARGLLTGTMRPGYEPSDPAHDRPMFHGEDYDRHLLAAERLGDWADQLYKASLPATAMRWALDVTGGIALWGARTPEHLDAVDDVWGWRIDEPAVRDVDSIVTEALDTKAVRRTTVRPLG